jgi:hypothetical protein
MKRATGKQLLRKAFLAKTPLRLARARVSKMTWLGVYEDTPVSKLLCVGRPGQALALRVAERCRSWPVIVRSAPTKGELLHEQVYLFGPKPGNRMLRPQSWQRSPTRGRKRRPPDLPLRVYLPPIPPSSWEASLAENSSLYAVLDWFCHDPARCADYPPARAVLRRYVSPFHPWIKPASVAGQKTQRGHWWESLRDAIGELQLGIQETVRDRYADYLAGFVLARENRQGRGTATWRAFRRSKSLKEIGIVAAESVIARHAPKDHLKIVLSTLMADDAVAAGWRGKAYLVPGFVLTPVWALVGEQIKPVSLAREIRRSRARKLTSKLRPQ